MSKIAILTSFAEINPGYSLTGIVEDQVAMLTRYGHEVHLFVQAGFNRGSVTSHERLKQAQLHTVIPFTHLVDYSSMSALSDDHVKVVHETIDILAGELAEMDVVITHDWCFTGWNLPYFLGVVNAVKDAAWIKCLHWIHSIPSPLPNGRTRDWWKLKNWPGNHKLVYPNRSDALRVAEMYQCNLEDILVIPHIKDPRSWFDFDSETCQFIDTYPSVIQADIVQLFPASCDRLRTKRIDDVIRIFGSLKERGRSVCLVVANQWASGRNVREDLKPYKELAESVGLVNGQELIFSSDYKAPKFEHGLSRRMIRELFQLSNLFVFPTDHESFGLVVPEAALGGVYLVGNESLTQQLEITGHQAGLYFRFGSYTHKVAYEGGRDQWIKSVAGRTLAEMSRDAAVKTKTYMRQHYNWDHVYKEHYQPLMEK